MVVGVVIAIMNFKLTLRMEVTCLDVRTESRLPTLDSFYTVQETNIYLVSVSIIWGISEIQVKIPRGFLSIRHLVGCLKIYMEK